MVLAVVANMSLREERVREAEEDREMAAVEAAGDLAFKQSMLESEKRREEDAERLRSWTEIFGREKAKQMEEEFQESMKQDRRDQGQEKILDAMKEMNRRSN